MAQDSAPVSGKRSGEVPFVIDEFSQLTHVVVCSPRLFVPGRAINPFQEVSYASDPPRREVLEQQHETFRGTLTGHGVTLLEVEPSEDFPYQMFTRDACFCLGQLAFRSNFRFDVREAETDLVVSAVDKIQWQELPDGLLVEGGDVLVAKPHVIVGLGDRTNLAAAKALSKYLAPYNWSILTVELDKDTLHLDTALGLLPGTIVVEFSGLAGPLPKALQRSCDVIEVAPSESRRLAPNFLAIDEQTVVMNEEHNLLASELSRRGFECIQIPANEFLKLGGGFHCLTLPIRRERIDEA